MQPRLPRRSVFLQVRFAVSSAARARRFRKASLPTPSAPASSWHPTAAYLSLHFLPTPILLPSRLRSMHRHSSRLSKRPCRALVMLQKLLARRASQRKELPIQILSLTSLPKARLPIPLRQHRQAPHKQQVVLELQLAALELLRAVLEPQPPVPAVRLSVQKERPQPQRLPLLQQRLRKQQELLPR